MKNILAIEIKDNKTVVTLTKNIDGMHNLLFHKTYGSKPLISNSMYDISIIDQMKYDLSRSNLLDLIEETYLTINTRRTFIHSYNLEINYNTDIDAKLKELKDKLEREYQINVIDMKASDNENSLTKKIINVIVEMVPSDYVKEVRSQLNYKGFKINKLVSVIGSIENSTKENSIKNGVTFNILMEEKFTQLTILKDANLISSIKWDYGLTNIYDYISEKMKIDKNSSKTLFSSFGSIPPEEVVDNKVIHIRKHGKENEIFTKKDLSRFITEQVNHIFADIKTHVDRIKEKIANVNIVFTGEITSLIGFKKYAAKSFAEPNITSFNSRIIGLKEETEFITVGILGENREYIGKTGKKPIEKLLTPKINVFKKLTRMYNYI